MVICLRRLLIMIALLAVALAIAGCEQKEPRVCLDQGSVPTELLVACTHSGMFSDMTDSCMHSAKNISCRKWNRPYDVNEDRFANF